MSALEALVLALTTLYGAYPRPVSAQWGVIPGQVLEEKTERPISDACIELRSRGVATRSDSSGRFYFANM